METGKPETPEMHVHQHIHTHTHEHRHGDLVHTHEHSHVHTHTHDAHDLHAAGQAHEYKPTGEELKEEQTEHQHHH